MSKPKCKFWDKCYRTSEAHRLEYDHPQKADAAPIDAAAASPDKILDVKPAEKAQKTPRDLSPQKPEGLEPAGKKSKVAAEPDPPTEAFVFEADISEYPPSLPLKDVFAKSSEQRQKYWASHLLAKYKLAFPQDFYDFWDFARSTQLLAFPESEPGPSTLRAFSDVLGGVVLAGPYEEMAGLFADANLVDVCYGLHDRYFFDPPEFLTVLKQESKDVTATATNLPHWGYVRDDPKDLPTFVAYNDGESPTFAPSGDNLFAALKYIIDTAIKEQDSPPKKLSVLLHNLVEFATARKYDLANKGKAFAARQKAIVAKTFSKLGIVVPFKNDIGYREFPRSDAQLKKLFGKMATEEKQGWKVNFDELDELKTLNTLANDESDPGMGLQFGLNMFASAEADRLLQRDIYSVLSQAYDLLNRPLYATITKLHVRHRYYPGLHNQRLPRPRGDA